MINPIISVIVPAYNSENYIEKCIDSILTQSIDNIEVIIVDDGSTDATLLICQKRYGNDERVHLYTQNNMGRVLARKRGFDLSKGEYISFVDSDDWVDKNMYENFLRYLNASIDMIAFGNIEEFATHVCVRKNTIPSGIYSREKLVNIYKYIICGQTFFEWGILPSLCNKLIKRSLISFSSCLDVDDRIEYGEDMVAVFKLCMSSKTIAIDEACPYHYLQHNYDNGLMRPIATLTNIRIVYDELLNAIPKDVSSDSFKIQINKYIWFILLINQYEYCAYMTHSYLFPYNGLSKNDRIVIYGAGGLGVCVYKYISKHNASAFVAWLDLDYTSPAKYTLGIKSPEEISSLSFDKVIIAVLNGNVSKNIKNFLLKKGIQEENICMICEDDLTGESLDWLINYDT